LMQKYAEGQPFKRYYQGNDVIDEIESLCEERALEAFGLDPDEWFANVQAHSGSPANLAVYSALLNVGDKIMSMYLPDGGHLSHGWSIRGLSGMKSKKISFSSKIYDFEFYYVDKNKRVFDYNQIEEQVHNFKPKLIISGGTAYPREIDHKRMGEIAKKVGAYYLADIAHEAGLIAAGANNSPFPYADMVTMTTHKTLRGPRGAIIIGRKQFEEALDFAVFPGLQGGPHMHSIAGIAIALEKTKSKDFINYAFQTIANAKHLAELLQKKGLDVVSSGTDKHLILIDLRKTGTNGWIIGDALEGAGIIANRNTVPLEDASPFYPSGLRLGTPAVTIRGMKEKEMEIIGEWIFGVIMKYKDFMIPKDKDKRSVFIKDFRYKVRKDKFLNEIFGEVKSLCRKFPVT
jgi:glycine hydroxymethyltransferase